MTFTTSEMYFDFKKEVLSGIKVEWKKIIQLLFLRDLKF